MIFMIMVVTIVKFSFLLQFLILIKVTFSSLTLNLQNLIIILLPICLFIRDTNLLLIARFEFFYFFLESFKDIKKIN